ncbi:hypothetical protein V2J09_001726 [Rumex salicifolius]
MILRERGEFNLLVVTRWKQSAMPASTSKTLSLIFRAAAARSKATTTTAKKATKSVASSTTKSSKLALPSIHPNAVIRLSAPSKTPSNADASDSAPSRRSYEKVCVTAFTSDQTSPCSLNLSDLITNRLNIPSDIEFVQEDADEHVMYSSLLRQVSFTINGSSDLQPRRSVSADEMLSSMPTTVTDYRICASANNKKVSHEKKKKWIYKNTQNVKYKKLIESCAGKFGPGVTISVFGRLGRDTGIKEYNTLLGICIESAKNSEDEKTFLEQIYKAYGLFKSMKEHGFEIDEQTYGPFLMFLIDMHMVDEFYFFRELIKDESSSSNSRFGYYEMLLAIEINDETKIQHLSNQIAFCDNQRISALQEHYLMALCDGDRKKELLEILERIDINQVSSVENLYHIFSTLGRLSLDSFAVKFSSELKECGQRAQSISILISYYATGMTNVVVEEAVSKFRSMHAESGVEPSSLSYEKLIKFCCNSLEVREAINVANQMFAAGLTSSVETINYMLHSCEEHGEYHLVHSIYSMLTRFDCKSNSDTYRSLINLSVRAKDMQRAFSMLEDMQKVNISPTSSIYNALIAGFYREKNVKGALDVLERMEATNVKPDSVTFSFLIGNADSEEDITKYYKMMKSSGIHATKHVYMGLINAYANCKKFEEAKQVVLDSEIDGREIYEVRSVLASALASNGHIFDALEVYKDMKLGGYNLHPKAIISLIEHLQSTDKLSTLLQLVGELSDTDYWVDGSCRVIGYCLRNKNLRVAVDLLEEVVDKFHDNAIMVESVVNEAFSVIADIEPSDVQFGLDFLQAIKEDLLLEPTRRCLDFLLSACVTAKDPQSAGDLESAEEILKKIQLDDPHVRSVIRACRQTYATSSKKEKKKKEKKKKVKKVKEVEKQLS